MKRFVLSALSGVAILSIHACADSARTGFDETQSPTTPAVGNGEGGLGTAADSGAFAGCGASTYQAKALPAAMMFVLDKSGTMAQSGKYASAQAAIAQAIDVDAFDSMHLGLLGYPTSNVN